MYQQLPENKMAAEITISRHLYIMWFVCKWLAAGLWFSPDTPFPSTNKTDHLTEILLKVGLNTITLTLKHNATFNYIIGYSYIMVVSFIGRGNRVHWKKSPATNRIKKLNEIKLIMGVNQTHSFSSDRHWFHIGRCWNYFTVKPVFRPKVTFGAKKKCFLKDLLKEVQFTWNFLLQDKEKVTYKYRWSHGQFWL